MKFFGRVAVPTRIVLRSRCGGPYLQARSAPSDPMGLDGGAVGLSSLQSLLNDADEANDRAADIVR